MNGMSAGIPSDNCPVYGGATHARGALAAVALPTPAARTVERPLRHAPEPTHGSSCRIRSRVVARAARQARRASGDAGWLQDVPAAAFLGLRGTAQGQDGHAEWCVLGRMWEVIHSFIHSLCKAVEFQRLAPASDARAPAAPSNRPKSASRPQTHPSRRQAARTTGPPVALAAAAVLVLFCFVGCYCTTSGYKPGWP